MPALLPYARAAYEYASEHGKLKDFAACFEALIKAYEDDHLPELITRPGINESELAHLFAGALKCDASFGNFLALLAAKKRLAYLPEAAQTFFALLSEHQHQRDVQVILAKEADAKHLEALKAALKAYFHEEVALTVAIDADLIGGVKVLSGDVVIDGSVQGDLARLKKQLTS